MLKILFRIFSWILALIQLICGVGTFSPTVAIKNQNQPYPYVLVHGYAGWGFDDGLSDTLDYWGAFNGDLAEYLDSTVCECYGASMGSFSSAWDRACELYAQLTGTRVDYGKAHSEKYGHERYGKTYSEPLFKGWSKDKKVNLIAHSFGGNTVRLLAALMADGNAEEKSSTAESELSPLFAGGHDGWIYSITTLASPHNGTTMTDVLTNSNSDAALVKILYNLFAVLGMCDNVNDIFDTDFAQWNLSDGLKLNRENVQKLISTPDTGFYDLTLKGAAELNEIISIQDDIYYYSYAGCSTKKDEKTGYQVASGSPVANMMGKFKGTAMNSNIVVDETWWPNDGTVNTISALHPSTEPFCDYSAGTNKPGIWQVFPVVEISHDAFSGGTGMSKAAATDLADRIITQINIISSTY